jgi:glycogen synthase
MEWLSNISELRSLCNGVHHRTMTTIASPTYRRDIHNNNNKCNENNTTSSEQPQHSAK